MKKIKELADKSCSAIKVLFYLLTFLLPTVADSLFAKAIGIKDFVFDHMLVMAIVMVLSAAIVALIPQFAHLFSLVYLIAGSFLLDGMISDVNAAIQSGANQVDVAIRAIPFPFILLLGLLFVYLITSDGIVFCYAAFMAKNKRKFRAAKRSSRRLTSTIRSTGRKDIRRQKAFYKEQRKKLVKDIRAGRKVEIVSAPQSIYDHTKLHQRKRESEEKWQESSDSWNNKKLTILDRIPTAVVRALLGALVFTTLGYTLFVYSKGLGILAYLGEIFIGNLAFLVTDIVTIIRKYRGTVKEDDLASE